MNLRRLRRIRHHDLLNEINVTPFVDILLVLLAIFMVTAPLMTHSIAIQLPQGKADKTEATPPNKPISVLVDQDFNILLQDKQLKFEQLAEYLNQLPPEAKQTAIHLQMDQRVNHGFLIKIMLSLKNAGFQNVGLVFREEK